MTAFNGFPQEGLQFLQDIRHNNNRAWFEDHKNVYQNCIQAPALAFIETLGERLKTLSSAINYDTSKNGSGSLMRIYRDVRFSADKSPYKTNVGIIFWQGVGKKTENPGFYFHMDADATRAHAGMYGFPKAMLNAYREAVLDEKIGSELQHIFNQINQSDAYKMSEPEYKKVPRGFEADHPRADLLRYHGLGASSSEIAPEIVQSAGLVDVVFDHFVEMAPIQRWLVKVQHAIKE